MAIWKTSLMVIRRFFGRFVSHGLEALGGLWIVTQIGIFLFPSFTLNVQEYFWLILVLMLVVVIYGLWRAWPQLRVHSEISNTDVSIVIRVGDLFKQDGAIVVAAPTSFDTAMDDGTIDAKSVQGQYIRQFCNPPENLDRQIEEALDDVEYIELDEVEKPYGNRKKYPVGTVAPVNCKGRKAYFVALATLNKHQSALLTSKEFLDSLTPLWENIRKRGRMEPIGMPILGSGFSRLNATREVLVREIVKSFVVATHAGKFCERLTIVIQPRDFIEGKIDLESIGGFLNQECQYGNAMPLIDSKDSSTAV